MKSADDVFDELIWPGIAGSVTWSLVVMINGMVMPNVWPPGAFWRLLSISLMAFYLMYAWRVKAKRDAWFYFVFDAIFAFSISFFSVACASDSRVEYTFVASFSLIAVFGIAALWNAFHQWQTSKHKYELAFINLVGAVIVICGLVQVIGFGYDQIELPAWNSGSGAFVLICWFVERVLER